MYSAATPGVEGGDNGSIRLDLDNMPQPDAFLLCPAGPTAVRSRFSEDDYVEGAPELVAEVASSSVSYRPARQVPRLSPQRGPRVHRLAGPATGRSTGSSSEKGNTSACRSAPDGLTGARSFPGLWLDPAALIRGDSARRGRGRAGPGHARARGVRRPAAGRAGPGARPSRA